MIGCAQVGPLPDLLVCTSAGFFGFQLWTLVRNRYSLSASPHLEARADGRCGQDPPTPDPPLPVRWHTEPGGQA